MAFSIVDQILKSAASRFAALTASLFMNWLLVRQLSVSDFGQFSLSLVMLAAISQFSRSAMPSFVIKESSGLWGEDNAQASSVLNKALQTVLIASLSAMLFVAVFLLVAVMLPGAKNHAVPLGFSFLSILVFSLLWVFGAAFKAQGLPVVSNFLETGLIPTLMLVFLLVFGAGGVWAALGYYFLSTLVVVAFMAYVAMRYGWIFKAERQTAFKDKGGFIVRITFLNLLGYILIWGPYLVYSFRADPESIGVASLYMRIASLVFLANVVINSVVLPRFSAFVKAGDYKKARKIFLDSVSLSLALAVIVALVGAFFSSTIISFFSDQYLGEGEGFLWLWLVFSLALAFGLSEQGLVMLGREGVALRMLLFFVFLEVISVLLLSVEIYVLPLSIMIGFCGYRFLCCLYAFKELCRDDRREARA